MGRHVSSHGTALSPGTQGDDGTIAYQPIAPSGTKQPPQAESGVPTGRQLPSAVKSSPAGQPVSGGEPPVPPPPPVPPMPGSPPGSSVQPQASSAAASTATIAGAWIGAAMISPFQSTRLGRDGELQRPRSGRRAATFCQICSSTGAARCTIRGTRLGSSTLVGRWTCRPVSSRVTAPSCWWTSSSSRRTSAERTCGAWVPKLDLLVVTTSDPFYRQHDGESWRHEEATIQLVADFVASLPSG